MTTVSPTLRELQDAVGDRLDGSPLVALLDVDGTLAPIVPTPSEARVPESTRHALRRLAESPGVTVAFVSGRAASDAWRIAGVPGAWVIGNHGFELRDPDGSIVPDEAVRGADHAIADAASALTRQLGEIPGVIVENKRWTLSLHYRLVAPDAVPALRSTAAAVAHDRGLRVLDGKKIVELRPPVDVDKGTACLALLRRLGATAPHSSAFYAGDDRTDEDAFRSLRQAQPRAVTIRIAPADEPDREQTIAEFLMASPEEFRAVLEWVAERRASA